MKKGISLIALIISIIIVIILTTTITVYGNNIYNNSKKVKFVSELSYVQEMMDSYKEKNGEYPILDMLVFDTANISSDILSTQFANENITNSNIVLYKIDFSKLGITELTFANKDYDHGEKVYLLSKDTGKIYYQKGYKISRNVYYTLTDDLKKSINYTQKNNVNDGIIFDNEKTDLQNKLAVNIKIPKEYIVESVTSTDSNFSYTTTASESYNIYNTLSTKNSVITVTYKLNESSTSKSVTYTVDNVYNSIITFDIGNVQVLKNLNETKKYVEIKNLKDDVSGIKCIKYANQKIEEDNTKEYFNIKGINVSNNLIEIENNVSYITVYVEDNAGNYTVKYKSVDDVIDEYVKS